MSIITLIRPLAEIDFCSWVGQASPGDLLEYHRGFLAIDAAPGGLPDPERTALRVLGRRAAWSAEQRLVHLVQRRIGPGAFSYLAIRRPMPRMKRRVRLSLWPQSARPMCEAA